MTASGPSATNAAPTTPPISACEELDGSPKYQVMRFQAIAPIRPAEDDLRGDEVRLDDAVGDRRRDLEREERADEVEHRGVADRELRRHRARRDRRGHDVGRVVEAVGEVERERGRRRR